MILSTASKRSEFLSANRGLRVGTPAFVLLVDTGTCSPGEARVGFTVTRKIGNAVTRNRLKRRLREIARLELPRSGIPGATHILIGRDDGLARDFVQMRADLLRALDRVRAGKAERARGPARTRR